MEISILNNPLYISYTLLPGSNRAKVLPEDCPLVQNGRRGLERGPILGYWALPSTIAK